MEWPAPAANWHGPVCGTFRLSAVFRYFPRPAYAAAYQEASHSWSSYYYSRVRGQATPVQLKAPCRDAFQDLSCWCAIGLDAVGEERSRFVPRSAVSVDPGGTDQAVWSCLAGAHPDHTNSLTPLPFAEFPP